MNRSTSEAAHTSAVPPHMTIKVNTEDAPIALDEATMTWKFTICLVLWGCIGPRLIGWSWEDLEVIRASNSYEEHRMILPNLLQVY